MRFPLLLACATVLATGIATAGAAERCATTSGSVWIEGQWENSGGQYQWRPGYWQTSTTTVCTTPPQTWIDGHWAQGANSMVWVEGHYEQAPTVYATAPAPCPPPQTTVVYTPPPQVVYVQRPCPPQTTIVLSTGYGGYNSYNNCNNYGYGYGYQRPCPPPVTYCPPQRPVCAPARPQVSGGVCLPLPSIGFPTVQVGHHRLPVPIPVPIFGRR
jgi:hypothetical protein